MKRLTHGMTLIELLLAMMIGLFIALAIFGVLASAEGRKRVATGLSSIEQTGNIAEFYIDLWVRNGGSGFSAKADNTYGCNLHAKAASGQVLPLIEVLPAPFASVNPDGNGNFVLAPVLILPGATTPGLSGNSSDALVIMGGSAAMAGLPVTLTAAPDATAFTLSVNNALAFNASDLVLLSDPDSPSQCMIVQVTPTFSDTTATSVSLAGGFFSATVGNLSMGSFGSNTIAMPLGTPASTTTPQFFIVGVGDDNTLYTYDLLHTYGTEQALIPKASGVFEMHALYGIDSDDDGKQDSWASPSSGTYATSNLVAGASNLTLLLKRIKSVRVAMIMQTRETIKANAQPSPSSLTLFPDLAAQNLSFTRTLSADEQRYRYRVIEATMVLRNNLMLK
jgi:type IV pilus assembly protein PilW